MNNIPDTYPRKLPIGIYDNTIVTQEGENLFAAWDDYAIRILLKEKDAFEEIVDQGQVLAWSLASYDYSALKLFALSVLWRAHASAHPAFEKVRLGPHESKIRELLLNSEPETPEHYSVNIVRWLDDDFGPVFMNPFNERYDDVNYYRIYCGRYVLYIKVDRKPAINVFRELQLSPESSLNIVARELKQSNEWPLMQRIARENTR